MSKHEYIRTHKTIGYYSGMGGIEIKGIEYECGDSVVYAVSGAFCNGKSHHRVKIEYTISGDEYFRIRNVHIPMRDCMRV